MYLYYDLNTLFTELKRPNNKNLIAGLGTINLVIDTLKRIKDNISSFISFFVSTNIAKKNR